MAERVRVAYVADSTIDPRMIEGLAARMDLTLLVPRAVGVSTWEPDAPFARRGLGRGRLTFLIAATWWLLLRRKRYDVIIALDNVRAALAANAGGWIARRPVILQLGRPTVEYYQCRALYPHNALRFRIGLLVLSAIVRVNESMATAIGAISEHVAAHAARHAPHVERIPWYGVDPAIYRAGPTTQQARAALGISDPRALILFRSRLAHEKDPETFLEALRLARATGHDVAAFYVGGEYQEFVAKAEAKGVPVIGRDHVDPRTELPLFYAAADLTVQTSHAEGLGMSVLESLAMGTPVIVTGVGGLVEAVGRGAAGTVVAPRDPAELAETIGSALDHPKTVAVQVERGAQMVVEQYGSDETFSAWVALAEALMRAGRAHPLWGPSEGADTVVEHSTGEDAA